MDGYLLRLQLLYCSPPLSEENLHDLWVEELSFVLEGVVLTSTSALGCALNFMGFYVMITGKMRKAFSNQG